MRVWCFAPVFLFATDACGFRSSLAPEEISDAGMTSDNASDAPILPDASSSELCLGTYVRLCVAPPQSSITLPAAIDTSAGAPGSLCMVSTTTPALDACVIAGQSIQTTGAGKVSITGTRPLILIARDQITISGTLDAASHRNEGKDGPAAGAGTCPVGTAAASGTAGAGGWGASFGGPGNNGGNSFDAIGGKAPEPPGITGLRGGCSGGRGGNTGGGVGGHGGGALLLLAGREIIVNADATVNASGAGGTAGRTGGEDSNGGGGGGGGGSGGMIVLDAPRVVIQGTCLANGGGGGEGGEAARGGTSGGEATAPLLAGLGGAGNSLLGGDGGTGAYGTTSPLGGSPGAQTTDNRGGGGGGGGGAGFIKVLATTQQYTSDPSHVAPPPR